MRGWGRLEMWCRKITNLYLRFDLGKTIAPLTKHVGRAIIYGNPWESPGVETERKTLKTFRIILAAFFGLLLVLSAIAGGDLWVVGVGLLGCALAAFPSKAVAAVGVAIMIVACTGCASTQNDVSTKMYYPNGQPAMEHTDKSRIKGIRNPGPRTFGGGGSIFRFRAAVGGAGDMPLMVPAGGGHYDYYGGGPVETYTVPLWAIPATEQRTRQQYFGEKGHSNDHSPRRGYGY